jgi:hypothetical protein
LPPVIEIRSQIQAGNLSFFYQAFGLIPPVQKFFKSLPGLKFFP